MLPDPLHPAVVHFPIALAALIPLLALLALLAIARGWLPLRAWTAIVLLQALLVGSAWLALETGEDQEERVERVVDERHIEAHEEAAEYLLPLAAAGLALAAAGLLPGRGATLARVASIVGALIVLAAAVRIGDTGGALVYRHGAGQAYTERTEAASPPPSPPR
jgi:hypothetical protein